jgi:solute carrier family 13 (sodium-dependent dicarboxylate transporter), member 2/3/5
MGGAGIRPPDSSSGGFHPSSETETVQPGPAAGSGPFLWPSDRPPQAPRKPPPAPVDWQTWLQRLTILVGVAAAIWIYFMPTPAGLDPKGKTAFAVFTLSTTLWITNALPFGITGLLSVALLGITHAMTASDAFAAFGNSAVFFLIGVFLLAAALIKSGLSKRCALLFLSHFEQSPYSFAYGMTLVAALATVWMPAQATTAMLFPIAVEVALALKLEPKKSAYAKVLFLSLGWGAMVGSNASFLGSTRAALALGLLSKTYGSTVTITFSQWVIAALPVVVLGALAVPVVLRLCFPREVVDFRAARTVLEATVRELGPMGRTQWIVAGTVLATVASWVIFGGRADLASIALLGATSLFALRVLTWDQAEGQVYWNVVLMYGGAIALGVVIDQTGAAKWLIERVVGGAQIPAVMAVTGVCVATLVLSEFMSNAAAVAVMLPLAFSLGDRLGASPVALVLATSIGAGLDFALPFSSAPNTIVFASGYLRMSDVVKAGAIMTIVSLLIVLLVAHTWWGWLGIV